MKNSKSIRSLTLLAVAMLVGCSSSRDADFVKASNDSNIKKMGSLYQLYAARNGYRGPKSKEELLSFLTTDSRVAKNLELIGVDQQNINDYFISENDGNEYEIRWGVFVNPDVERARQPLVFEKEGVNGTRLVMLANRKVLEVNNDKQYNRLLKGKVNREEAKTDQQREEEAEAANS